MGTESSVAVKPVIGALYIAILISRIVTIARKIEKRDPGSKPVIFRFVNTHGNFKLEKRLGRTIFWEVL
jgi:hypothetical protein